MLGMIPSHQTNNHQHISSKIHNPDNTECFSSDGFLPLKNWVEEDC